MVVLLNEVVTGKNLSVPPQGFCAFVSKLAKDLGREQNGKVLDRYDEGQLLYSQDIMDLWLRGVEDRLGL
jgi:hypothetical protein